MVEFTNYGNMTACSLFFVLFRFVLFPLFDNAYPRPLHELTVGKQEGNLLVNLIRHQLHPLIAG